MAKAISPSTDFRFGRVFPAEDAQIRLAFRALLNRERSLKESPSKVLERLLDESVAVGGEKQTKREVIVLHLIELAGSGDSAASKLLTQFLHGQNEQRFEEQMASYQVNKEVLLHVMEKLLGK